MDTIKLELSKQLAASCCCLTKTNEPKYHDELCYYRLLMEKAAVDKPEVVLSNSTDLVKLPLRIENIRRGRGEKRRWLYAELKDDNGELLICATLDYIETRIKTIIDKAT